MRRVGVTVLLFALIFGFLATWLGPRLITYWYSPPVPAGAAAAFNCTDAVQWAMNKLVWTQLLGTAFGAIFGGVIGVLLGRRRPAAPPPRASAPVAPATPKA